MKASSLINLICNQLFFDFGTVENSLGFVKRCVLVESVMNRVY